MNGLCSLLIRAVLAVVVLAACVAPAVAQEVVEYIHTDALGSPVAITDASGNVIERTVYEPYGAVVNRPLKDGPGYTGHVTDSGTGLSYMQQRYYDPEASAFLSVDPISATEAAFGRYYYANGNPYRFTDPDGRAPEEKVRSARVATVGSAIKGGGVAPGSRMGTLGGARVSSGGSTSQKGDAKSAERGLFIQAAEMSYETEAVDAYGAGLRYTRDWDSKKDALGIVPIGVGARGGLSKSLTGLPAADLVKVGFRWGGVDAPVDIVGSFAAGPVSAALKFDPGTGLDLTFSASTSLGSYTGVSVMFDDTILNGVGK
ncbi:exported hypothetical protein [Stenotrophomonas geniculata]|uniref:RHS repeat-associated core domain-containing protein n=1 Tax=Stenotrophomonas geniculata TaxID=86188 RepID=UPI00374AC123